MSVIVISSDSPTFTCQSPSCVIDAESIDTSYVYDSNYASTCDVNDTITLIGGGEDGTDGTDGTDGRGIVSIVRTSGDGSPGTTDTYTITYTDSTTSTFNVYNGEDGLKGDTGDAGTAATVTVGTTTTGDAGTSASVVNVGDSLNAILNFTIPKGIDGATITATSSLPTGGNNGDLHIYLVNYDLYQKISGVWTVIGNVKGTKGDTGNDGTDGSDGDIWQYGSGIPTDTTIYATHDVYYLDILNKDIYYKVANQDGWVLLTNINGDNYKTSSTDTISLDSLSIGDPLNITVDSNLAYTTGQFVVITNTASNQITGKVVSYSGTTLAVSVTYVLGTGSYATWDVNLAGVVEAESRPQWYTITATAGTGTVTSRTFTAPTGWLVDSSDNIAVTGLGSGSSDLTIKHNTGLYALDAIVMINDGTKYTKAKIPVSYSTLYEDSSHLALELSDFCTEQKALLIHVKLQ